MDEKISGRGAGHKFSEGSIGRNSKERRKKYINYCPFLVPASVSPAFVLPLESK